MNLIRIRSCLWVALSVSAALMSVNAAAQNRKSIDVDKARVVEFWTPERIAAAIPRDLVIDSRGLGYLRHPDGFLQPYGHKIRAEVTPRSLPPSPFAKPGGPGGGGGGGGTTTNVIKNAEWTADNAIQRAAGRLLFAMDGGLYVCSGTVVAEPKSDRSIILTAAHCVYDDVAKAFATNVKFIPDQAHTSSGKTDTDCTNDPLGCWVPTFGVVDVEWANKTFPKNIAWDYAFYVVNNAGAHIGGTLPDELDAAVNAPFYADFELPPRFNVTGSRVDYTFALGYSYRFDPKFMYCAEDMTVNGSVNWWLPSCGLSGGSSGGPWVQVQDGSTSWSGDINGKIYSVNSWGYQGKSGMAGPKLSGNSATCVFDTATSQVFDNVGSPGGGGKGAIVSWASPSTCSTTTYP